MILCVVIIKFQYKILAHYALSSDILNSHFSGAESPISRSSSNSATQTMCLNTNLSKY